ncbi:hypothetical protein EMGBS8_20780 [Verrucomicrobiota bacterium]|nr:hypothetical protein EMGBS8_20780 [Verrucomicrobiota bacterium]
MLPRLFTVLLCLTAGLRAAYPEFSACKPNGGQRGSEFKLSVTGTRLEDFETLLFYDPGFTVKSVDAVAAGKVDLTIAVSADATLGSHLVRVRTRTGLSHPRQFFVSPYPTVDEKEANSEFAQAQAIPLNSTIEGIVLTEDVDYFKVTVKKGQRLSLEVDGLRLGYLNFDPYIAILDKDRFEKAFSDDTILHRQDGYCSFVAEYDGDYYVMVRESSYRGSTRSFYRLHVGDFRRPDVVFPAGGKVGSKVDVRFIDAKGSFTGSVTVPSEEDPSFEVFSVEAPAPSGNPFRISQMDNFLESEPNSAREQANVVPPAEAYALNGIIGEPGDSDYYRLTLKKGQVLTGHAYAQGLGSPLDPVISLRGSTGVALISNDDGGGTRRLDSRFEVTVPADGEYMLSIRDHLDRGSPKFVYRVELIASQPRLTFASPEYSVNDSHYRQFIAVPRGGRMALLENFSRTRVSGDFRFVAPGLPAGVKLLTEHAPKDMPNAPLLFEAAADAPLGQAIVPVRLEPVDPQNKVIGRLRQNFDVVRDGNVIYLTDTEDRLPVVVVEEAPYALEIVMPKVPLVQNGVYDLKVVAKRKPGFAAAIRVVMVWTPPGISSLGEMTIPAGANECFFQLNANAGVATAEWKFVVMGEADAGRGRVFNASPFCGLKTQPAYVAAPAFPMAAIEQGQEGIVTTKLEQLQPFEGEAVARLVGIPDTIASEPIKITKASTDLTFRLKPGKDCFPGKLSNLFIQVDVPLAGGTTTHRVALGSSLRVDAPRKVAPAPVAKVEAPKADATKPAVAPAAPVVLSRLEQLRQQAAAGTKQ